MPEILSEFKCNFHLLVISTCLSFLSVHSSVIEKPVLRWLNKKSGKEKDLLLQKNELKAEQSSLNMVDEFAKYSKIQRRINAIDEQLGQIHGSKPTNNFMIQLSFTYSVKLFLVFCLILLSLYYRYTPVFYLGKNVNLTPFTNFICYPNEENYVSFYFWVMCSAAVARSLK